MRPGIALTDVAPLLHDALTVRARQAGAPMIVWKDFPDTLSAALDRLCASWDLFKLASYPGTRLSVPTGGFDGYLQALTSSHRHNLCKKLRRSKALGELQATLLQHPSPALLEAIFPLFLQTYAKGKTKFEHLTPKFFKLIAAEDTSYFVLLRNQQTGKLVAFMLCFRIGSRVINKFIGLDYALSGQWFLYFRLLKQAIIWVSLSAQPTFKAAKPAIAQSSTSNIGSSPSITTASTGTPGCTASSPPSPQGSPKPPSTAISRNSPSPATRHPLGQLLDGSPW